MFSAEWVFVYVPKNLTLIFYICIAQSECLVYKPKIIIDNSYIYCQRLDIPSINIPKMITSLSYKFLAQDGCFVNVPNLIHLSLSHICIARMEIEFMCQKLLHPPLYRFRAGWVFHIYAKNDISLLCIFSAGSVFHLYQKHYVLLLYV